MDDTRYALMFVCVVFTRWMFPQRLCYMFLVYIIVYILHGSINFNSHTNSYMCHTTRHPICLYMQCRCSESTERGDCQFACNRSSVAVDQRYTEMYIFNRTQHIYNGCMFVYTSTLVWLQVTCVVVCCMCMSDGMRL